MTIFKISSSPHLTRATLKTIFKISFESHLTRSPYTIFKIFIESTSTCNPTLTKVTLMISLRSYRVHI
ncbi:hypothetical protein TYRP_023414 [Tyrophagus putrescentiae]|nr:hypothetical protein TYRP_023414 [Tyrophagus putrescentiae]